MERRDTWQWWKWNKVVCFDSRGVRPEVCVIPRLCVCSVCMQHVTWNSIMSRLAILAWYNHENIACSAFDYSNHETHKHSWRTPPNTKSSGVAMRLTMSIFTFGLDHSGFLFMSCFSHLNVEPFRLFCSSLVPHKPRSTFQTCLYLNETRKKHGPLKRVRTWILTSRLYILPPNFLVIYYRPHRNQTVYFAPSLLK